jgi:hypothetical protein
MGNRAISSDDSIIGSEVVDVTLPLITIVDQSLCVFGMSLDLRLPLTQ